MENYDVREHLIGEIVAIKKDLIDLKNKSTKELVEILLCELEMQSNYHAEERYETGFDEGYDIGYTDGYNEGLDEGANLGREDIG